MSPGRNKFSAGFTIAELLVALAVTGLLLAAVAVAFNSSVINYRENEDIFKTMNSARQALLRMTNDLRTANAVDPCSPANECALQNSSDEFMTYRYSGADQKLYLDYDGNSYVLCDNVTAMTFERNTAGSPTYVTSVQLSITVSSGNIERRVCAAAVVRRNLRR